MVLRRRDRGSNTTAEILPGYSGLEEIGGGAFATVYRATEIDTGRQVALKILKVDTVHSHLLETFHQEIQALGKVSHHPNIVTLYRPLSTPDGRPVLVLELCKESLAQVVRASGPLDARTVMRVGVKVAGALETAHRNGFLHRDMKPQNILVTQFGEPALADFGVAALQASAQATAGVFGFTTLHAAPEMLEGHVLSPATDIYGLASTMYQLLTGLAPFATFDNEAPASVILRIIRDPVRPLRSEGVPVELSDLLEAALAKDPQGRPATAAEFAESIQAIEGALGWVVTDCVVWGSPLTVESWGLRSPAPPPGSAPSDPAPPIPVPEPKRPALDRGLPAAVSEPEPSPAGPSPLVPGSLAPSLPAGGPSVAAPEVLGRNVIVPDDAVRGQPDIPIDAPARPLEPIGDPESTPVFADRPVFVDPGPDYAGINSPGETVYEETLQGGEGLSRPRPEQKEVTPAPSWWHDLPAYFVIGVGAAVVVVVLALLLIVGTI
jgi:serine/threonine-protein kinase PknK